MAPQRSQQSDSPWPCAGSFCLDSMQQPFAVASWMSEPIWQWQFAGTQASNITNATMRCPKLTWKDFPGAVPNASSYLVIPHPTKSTAAIVVSRRCFIDAGEAQQSSWWFQFEKRFWFGSKMALIIKMYPKKKWELKKKSIFEDSLGEMVGATGFEPATSSSQKKLYCSKHTQLCTTLIITLFTFVFPKVFGCNFLTKLSPEKQSKF